MQTETHARSIAKAVSWRVVGSMATSGIVWLVTRQPLISLTVAGLDFVSKTGLYWFHERMWDRVRAGRRHACPAVIWLTGLSGAGKSTLAKWLAHKLERAGYEVEHLDGDTVRTIFPATGFSRADRDAHIRRVGHLAARLECHGIVVIASFISPYAETRAFVRSLCRTFVEVHVATPLAECERRDVKGLYKQARRGEIERFTGISDPYEAPERAEVVVDTRNMPVEVAGTTVLRHVLTRIGG